MFYCRKLVWITTEKHYHCNLYHFGQFNVILCEKTRPFVGCGKKRSRTTLTEATKKEKIVDVNRTKKFMQNSKWYWWSKRIEFEKKKKALRAV